VIAGSLRAFLTCIDSRTELDMTDDDTEKAARLERARQIGLFRYMLIRVMPNSA
jgi:hypothetical protein